MRKTIQKSRQGQVRPTRQKYLFVPLKQIRAKTYTRRRTTTNARRSYR